MEIKIDDNRTFKIKRIKNHCFHDKGIIVDEETRTIECSLCEAKMSPFDYLHKMCFTEENALKKLNTLQVEVKKLEKRYANLTKEIERLNKIKKRKND